MECGHFTALKTHTRQTLALVCSTGSSALIVNNAIRIISDYQTQMTQKACSDAVVQQPNMKAGGDG